MFYACFRTVAELNLNIIRVRGPALFEWQGKTLVLFYLHTENISSNSSGTGTCCCLSLCTAASPDGIPVIFIFIVCFVLLAGDTGLVLFSGPTQE